VTGCADHAEVRWCESRPLVAPRPRIVRLVTVISLMLAVPDAAAASAWYQSALGATELWNLGSVIGLELQGAPFFLGQPENNNWESPVVLGTTTVRVEVFVDDPDTFVNGAAAAGATYHDPVRDHDMPWGTHRQGGFIDPYGHLWLVGDTSPLRRRS
jgi:PhnB protein